MFIIFIDAQIFSVLSVYSFLVITFIMLVLSLPSFKSLNISLSYNSVIWNTWEPIYELFSTDSSGKWIQITLAPFQEFRLKLEISSSVPPPVLIPVSACLHCLGFSSQFVLFLLLIVVVEWEALEFLFLCPAQLSFWILSWFFQQLNLTFFSLEFHFFSLEFHLVFYLYLSNALITFSCKKYVYIISCLSLDYIFL